MNKQDIEYVTSIAQYKSISKAAEALYITQPSLSRSINKLEQRLGLKLFYRKSDGVELTQAGAVYVEYGEQILRLQRQMEQELNELRQINTQHINIAMTLNASYMSTAKIQALVGEKYPNCSVRISNIRSIDIEKALHDRKFSFAVGPEVIIQDTDLNREVITEEYLLLLVPERWDFRPFAEIKPDIPYPWLDLNRVPAVDYILQEETSAMRMDLDSVLQEYGLNITPKMVTINSTLAIQAVERQMGCCFSSEVFLPFIGNCANIQLYCVGKNIKKTRTCLIYLKDKKWSPQEKYTLETVKKQFQDDYRRIAENTW